MDFTEDQIYRYSRHILLPEVGGVGQKKLLDAKVLCLGAGGLGSPILQYLAAAGVGTIGVLDFWNKSIEVRKLRGNIDTEILLAEIPDLTAKHERLAVEIVKLAEKRHGELVK